MYVTPPSVRAGRSCSTAYQRWIFKRASNPDAILGWCTHLKPKRLKRRTTPGPFGAVPQWGQTAAGLHLICKDGRSVELETQNHAVPFKNRATLSMCFGPKFGGTKTCWKLSEKLISTISKISPKLAANCPSTTAGAAEWFPPPRPQTQQQGPCRNFISSKLSSLSHSSVVTWYS